MNGEWKGISLQKFARPVQRAKLEAGLREVSVAPSSRSTMVKTSAISAPARARLDRLQRRTARRGDVLDDHHALALQALALGESLHREPGAVLLRLLADEKRGDRVALDP